MIYLMHSFNILLSYSVIFHETNWLFPPEFSFTTLWLILHQRYSRDILYYTKVLQLRPLKALNVKYKSRHSQNVYIFKIVLKSNSSLIIEIKFSASGILFSL